MSMVDCCKSNRADSSIEKASVGVSVNVSVDVPKIVKYLCLTAIAIVGIIFGSRCYNKMMENGIIKPIE